MMVDELAFFLHCRNLLFKGPQLGIASGQFSTFHYVQLSRVEEIIDVIMEKFNQADRSELKTLLRKKARKRQEFESIDISLVLRILLEYYIREKKCKYIALRTLFTLAPKNPQGSIKFGPFKDIVKNLNPDSLDSTIAKLYRDCYSYGNGIINEEKLFLIFNENSFFFQSLRLKNETKLKEAELKQVFSSFGALKTSLNLVRDAVKNLGNSDILCGFLRLEQCILSKDLGDTNFNPKTSFKHLWTLASQAQNVFMDVNSVALSAFYTKKISELEISAGPKSCKSLIEIQASLALYKLSTKIAIRKIQRNWKKKHSTNASVVQKTQIPLKKLITKN